MILHLTKNKGAFGLFALELAAADSKLIELKTSIRQYIKVLRISYHHLGVYYG